MANISMDTLMIEIQSSTKNATSSIQSLINKLKTLNQSLESVMKQSESFSKLRTSIDNATKGINIPKQTKQTTQTTPNINMDNVKPTTNMSDLASQSTVLSKQGSLLSNYRSQLQAVGLTQSTLGKQISQTTNQTTKGTTEITKYQNSLGQLTVRARTASDGLTRYTTSLRNANKESKNNFLKSLTSGLSGATLQFRLAWDTIRGITTTLGNLAMNGGSYYENLNLFATTLGDKAQEAFDWVNKFSDALYLDPSSVMQYMGTFNSLIKGLGVGTDDAYLMSQQLTQLTYDLSSFKNIPIEQAFEKLQSGISGEIEPLRNVGVALSEATLQELAYSLGIEKSVSAMSEAEKAQLRYIQILRSSSDWQGDMGKTLTSPANAIRVLREQFSLLGRAIGNVFIPILMMAIPYVMVITEWLTNLANALADILERIFGIDLDFSLGDYSDFDTGGITSGLEDIGDTADKTKNKLNTMLAPFDELNNIQTKSKSDSDDDGLGGLGGDLGVDLPGYDALSKLTDQFNKNIDNARKNLEGLIPVVLSIGAGIAAWKISKKLLEGIDTIKSLASKDFSLSFSILGITNFLADLDRLKEYIDDILKNGANFTNVTGLLSEFAGSIGDIFITLGKTKLGGSLKVVQGIGEIVSAISDIAKTGVDWDNMSTIITGLTNIAIGIGAFTKNAKLAGAATAIQGLTGVIEEVHDNWDAIKKGDWSGIDKAQLIISGLQILGGLVVAFDVFNKIKSGVNMTKTVENVTEVGNTISGIDNPTSTLTKSLGSLAKNLGLGLIVIAEVAAAAVLFVGAIWALGAELEQVGLAWEPVLDNGETIATAIGLGTLILVAIGTAAGLLGMATTATGYALPIAIGLGTLMLVELGAAAILFIAEVWAIGTGLDQIRIAWQPVLDNGETIATSITVATGLLIGIGVATAALGTATVASVGLLPVAIGLGTALLVELVEATKAFVDSVTDVAKQINDRLSPELERINENAPTVTKGLNNYMSFLKKFASIISESTKVDLLSGFKSLVDGLIGLFADDPIEKLAKDVNKTYTQTKDLNKKLKDANPELEEAIDLTSEYLKLISKLDKLAKNNKTSKLSRNLFTNMKNAGRNIITGLVSGMNSKISSYNSALNNIYNAIDTNRGRNAGYNFGAAMASGINNGIRSNLNTTLRLLNSGKSTGTSFTIRAYASGGYPDSASLFFANENGIPEMIGRIGNQTAVANNDQITTAIASAVTQAINNSNFGQNGSPTVIYIGNKKVYEGYGQHVQRENDRYGTNTIRI